MGRLINGITDHLTEILIGLIEFCLKHMFDDINNGMKGIITLVAIGPASLMPDAFKIVKEYLGQSLSVH